VKTGDVLVSFDTTDLETAIKQAEINYSNALLQKRMLENTNNEIRKLESEISQIKSSIDSLSKNPLNAFEVAELQTNMAEKRQLRTMLKPVTTEQFKQVENSIALAKLAVESAKSKIENRKDQIIAEFDGVITSVNIVEGGVGNPALPVIVEMDLTSLKAVISAGKYDAAKIKLDQVAEIKTETGQVTGKVSFIEPVAKKIISAAGGDTFVNVEVDISEKSEALKIDFDTDINILLASANNVIKVPAEAVKSEKEGKTSVFVVESGKAVEREIILGIQSDLEAEVKSGLKEGERIILNPTSSIINGISIRESNQ
jgi:HlyD family secretion protein